MSRNVPTKGADGGFIEFPIRTGPPAPSSLPGAGRFELRGKKMAGRGGPLLGPGTPEAPGVPVRAGGFPGLGAGAGG
jgi:hypothetical protein